jgi:hypothetical protein
MVREDGALPWRRATRNLSVEPKDESMRIGWVALWMSLFTLTPATAQVSVGVGIGLPGVSIGINLPAYPQLVRVPGYPVYYAPRLDANLFFYDGMYWAYQGDNWYASSWYNGPWGVVAPEFVPVYVLRVPVRYYRQPPVYFRGWRADAPPRWGEHWGREWEQRRSGWDRWNRSSAPSPAPLPSYQRQYSGNRYPPVEQQNALRSQHYRYQPRDVVVREHYQQHGAQRPSGSPQRATQGGAPGSRPPPQQGTAPRAQPMAGSQGPGNNPKAKGPPHEKGAEKGGQQGPESRK